MTNGKNGGVSTWVQVLIGGTLVVLTLASGFFSLSNSGNDKQIAALKEQLVDLKAEVSRFTPKVAYEENVKRVDKDVFRIDASVSKIQADMVPLSTHQQKWAADAARMQATRIGSTRCAGS